MLANKQAAERKQRKHKKESLQDNSKRIKHSHRNAAASFNGSRLPIPLNHSEPCTVLNYQYKSRETLSKAPVILSSQTMLGYSTTGLPIHLLLFLLTYSTDISSLGSSFQKPMGPLSSRRNRGSCREGGAPSKPGARAQLGAQLGTQHSQQQSHTSQPLPKTDFNPNSSKTALRESWIIPTSRGYRWA